jgi:DNA polymerase III delta prime subunit
MEMLTYIEEKHPSDAREYFNQHPTEEGFMDMLGFDKDYLISRGVTTLFPDRNPTPAEVQNLIRMIHKEEDTSLRAKLILILALNGNIQEAQEELSNYLLTIGYGNSDRDIANFFRSYNDLLRHADLLINEGFYPEPIIEALRSILNEPGNDWGMRTHAAIKLILAGEL